MKALTEASHVVVSPPLYRGMANTAPIMFETPSFVSIRKTN